jgi:hypothetical protein
MTEPPAEPQSYLLRLWQASSAGKPVWRALLVSVRTGDRCGFADLESLFAFLEGQTGADARPADRPPSTEP